MEIQDILCKYFPVLDKGFIALIDYMGGDETIEQYARVSYGKGTRKLSETRGLIRYLVSHHHSTPLESTELAFHIALPIHVARQLVRHRTFSPINEYSQRYSIVPELYYQISAEQFKAQSKINKQGRGEQLENILYENFIADTTKLQDEAFDIYKEAIDNGVAREIARMHLPLNTYTYWYCKMDLNNLMKMLVLRLDSHAQWEIRQYAHFMACMFKVVAPLTFEAFVDYRLCAKSFTRLDLQLMDRCRKCSIDLDDSGMIESWAKEIGMSDREFGEYLQKLQPSQIPNFDLDLSQVKDPSYFEEQLV